MGIVRYIVVNILSCFRLDLITSQSTIMLSRSFQGESSVLRARLRVVKNPLQNYVLAHYEYTLAHYEYALAE